MIGVAMQTRCKGFAKDKSDSNKVGKGGSCEVGESCFLARMAD